MALLKLSFKIDRNRYLIELIVSGMGRMLKSFHVAIHICDVVGQGGVGGALVARWEKAQIL
ncbi:hypothetical protein DXM22_03055 [Agrobacterium vitis]|nr:hypothetical protein DXM22_03055 [Agrobacterium vitis]